VLVKDSFLRHQLQKVRRRFEGERCKELPWLKCNRITDLTTFELSACFKSVADRNSNTVKGFAGHFKLETFKKCDLIVPTSKMCNGITALLASEDTPLAVCMKQTDRNV
jgi:hypothetical protein